MPDIETSNLFAVAVGAYWVERLSASRACALPMTYPLPPVMDGKLLALASPEAEAVFAIAIATGSTPSDDGYGHWWQLNEIVVIPPVPCRVRGHGLFALQSAVARLVVENGMEAAGLTIPTATTQARGNA